MLNNVIGFFNDIDYELERYEIEDNDTEAPIIVFRSVEKTQSSEIIEVTVTDNASGIAEIEKPDGTKIILDGELTYTFQYTATMNRNMPFTARDKARKRGTESYNVTGLVVTIEGINGIVADVRDMDLGDGIYYIKEGPENDRQTYHLKITNFYEDVTLTSAPTAALATTATDGAMVVLKYHGNLTINSGITLTPNARTKGMYICVKGALQNSGTISMTARGAYAVGQDVYLYKNGDVYDYVPKAGAAGAARIGYSGPNYSYKNGAAGAAGSNRRTGGGGSGGVSGHSSSGYSTAYSGAGAAGTSYSGGAGGGHTMSSAAKASNGSPGGANGGAGGAGGRNSYWTGAAGAGNPSGGTGGLLIIYGDSIVNNGTFSSNGSAGGSGSGGGTINIYYSKESPTMGTVTYTGGAGNKWSYATGGRGGNGTATWTQIP